MLEEGGYYYRVHNEPTMHKYDISTFESEKYLHRFFIPVFKRRGVSAKMYKQLEWIVIENLLLGVYEAFLDKEYLYPYKGGPVRKQDCGIRSRTVW